MKQLLIIGLLMLGILCPASAQQNKSAILVAHYGSSDAETRAKTLDVITAEVRKAFPDKEVREAYISPAVRRKLAKEGIQTDSPIDALLKLRADGYTEVFVQSTTLIEGGEMASVRNDVEQVRPFFEDIRVGTPLLYSVADCERIIELITKDLNPEKHEAIIYIGHGNQLPSTATYAMLDYMMQTSGHTAFHVSTIEGYPNIESTVAQLQKEGVKSVRLIPLLLVCGNHTKEDIAGVWKEELTQRGYKVQVMMQGLGENPAIRQVYQEHIQVGLSPRP